jgi:hypothetical protein
MTNGCICFQVEMICGIWCQYIVLWHRKCAGQSKSLIHHRCLSHRLIPFLCNIFALLLVYSFFLPLSYHSFWNFQLLKLLVENKWGVNYQSWENFRQKEDLMLYIKAVVVNATIEELEEKVKSW